MDVATAIFFAGAAVAVLVVAASAARVRSAAFSAGDIFDVCPLTPVLAVPVFLPSTLREAGVDWAEAGVRAASDDPNASVELCVEIR